MRYQFVALCALAAAATCLTPELRARGRIGGGRVGGGVRSVPRGGFSGRGISGGGVSRSRMPSRMPSGIQNRGTLNRSPSFSTLRAGGSRIGSGSSRVIGSGSRTPGSSGLGSNRSGVTIRPGIGPGGIQPGTRPQIGSGIRAGTSSRVGSGSLGSGRVNTGQFPGLGSRSTTNLPGLGNSTDGQRLTERYPNINRENLRQQIGNAEQSPTVRREKLQAWHQQQSARRVQTQERRQELQDRFSQVDREGWQQHRNENREDRQEYRDGAREDWQNWYDDNYSHHYGWHNGCWHDDWEHIWDEHPVAAAFGLT